MQIVEMTASVFKEKAIENLAIAQLAYDNKKYNACANRAYYAMFHIATALLIKEGNTYKKISHEKIIADFAKQYCNNNKTFPELRTHLITVQDYREKADYKNTHINKKDARKSLKRCEEFVNKIIKRF